MNFSVKFRGYSSLFFLHVNYRGIIVPIESVIFLSSERDIAMSFLTQIPSGLNFAFLLGFIVSAIAAIIQFANSQYSVRQMAQASITKAIQLVEDARPDIDYLYFTEKSGKRFCDWGDDERKAADNVVRTFDILGVLDDSRNIDRSFVDRFYAGICVEMWRICRPFVIQEQDKRGKQYLWEFEQFAMRVENVYLNHPALSGRKTWPRNPRRKHFQILKHEKDGKKTNYCTPA